MHTAIQSPTPARSALILRHPATPEPDKSRPTNAGRLAIPVSDGIRFIKYTHIVYCTSESNYCRIMLSDGRNLLFSKTLKWVTGQLPAGQFIRSHASFLVNRDFVELFTQEFIELEGGYKVPVARSKRSQVRSMLKLQN